MKKQTMSAVYIPENVRVTYEVSHNEPLHPDLLVAARMMEVGISKSCPDHGCKLYKDPWSNVVVLAHNSAYGCYK